MDHRDDSRSPARPRSEDLDRLYDEDYFSGRSSGYGSGGYRQDHPDWDAWLDVIQRIQPRGRLVDLGCAFGFLVEKSRSRGYRATGLDVSRHALLQEPSLRPFLARADLHHLPLAEGAADVVALFDVLEHLNDPLLALREASRILSPEGLLVGATPDPVFFNRPEPTHIFERPPSFWLSALEDLGLAASFRFSEEPYNFQFVAARRGSDTAGRLSRFQHDHVDEVPDFFIFGEALQGAPRQGWGALRQGSRRLARSPALLYLYNPARTPQRLVVRFGVAHSPDFALLRVRLDSLVLLELPLTAEKCAHQVEAPAVLLPSGGHHLFFELLPDGPEVNLSELRIESSPARTDDLAVTLPFDLYQRYRLAGELCRILDPSSILDVGGYLGDADGHLATSADFLSPKPDRVRSTDLRQLDWPRHHPAKAWEQPCGDASFDMAVSLDVLEHLPEAERPRFLAELDRISKRWIVLGGPFRSAEVVEAERELSASLLQDRAFLDEHQEEGLPEIEQIVEFYEKRGLQVVRLPNGYLPRWKTLQALTQRIFSSHRLAAIQGFNRLYNLKWYPHDQHAPCYRTVLLISKTPLGEERQAIEALLSPHPGPPLTALLADPEFLEIERLLLEVTADERKQLQDVRFLINERQKLIGLQEQELEWLRRELQSTPLWKLARRRWRQRRSARKGRDE